MKTPVLSTAQVEIFWDDALHRNEQEADHAFCQIGGLELV